MTARNLVPLAVAKRTIPLLTLAAILAQSADLLTWLAFRPYEMNPLVRELDAAAVPAKIALLVVLASLYRATGRHVVIAPLAVATMLGLVGAWSNTPWDLL